MLDFSINLTAGFVGAAFSRENLKSRLASRSHDHKSTIPSFHYSNIPLLELQLKPQNVYHNLYNLC